jgi:hypothetical protein
MRTRPLRRSASAFATAALALATTVVATVVAASTLAACSDDKPGAGDGGVADLAMPPGDDAAAPADLAMSVGPRTFTTRGYVNAINGSSSTNVGAAFYQFAPGHCTLTPFGLCEVVVCDDSDADLGAYHDSNAGTITLGTGTAVTTTLTFGSGGYQAAPPLPSGSFAWDPGTAIPVAAAGGPVAAFTATVTMPAALTSITAPKLTGAPIARDQDLTVSWSGGSQYVFIALQASDRARGPIAQCLIPAAAGSAIFPKAALALLPAGSYTFEVIAADVRTLPVADTFLHVAAGNSGAQSGVTSYNQPVTLQ